eukprot:scaffold2552_cov380-Prasinococcus_capsulatus_cf.AAC.33
MNCRGAIPNPVDRPRHPPRALLQSRAHRRAAAPAPFALRLARPASYLCLVALSPRAHSIARGWQAT